MRDLLSEKLNEWKKPPKKEKKKEKEISIFLSTTTDGWAEESASHYFILSGWRGPLMAIIAPIVPRTPYVGHLWGRASLQKCPEDALQGF